MKRSFVVRRDNPRRATVCEAAIQHMRERYGLGQDFDIEIRDPRRTLPENALLHALIAELARKLEWAGARREAEVWKRLLVAAWCRVNGQGVEVLPALDGHGVDIVPARTSRLSKRDCADLIEFIYAWGAEQGVRWDEHREIAA
ncbi:recombination protein NinB [Luteimonas sp. TWI662]|uniref:recombination protein NinB n=1 Tax=Luteimonas sp. TWI662 TaxID=3136789 RepID=UPI00320A5834